MAMLILQISVVLLLILVNGFFAMAEIALVSSRKARLQSLAEAGSANARAALALKTEPAVVDGADRDHRHRRALRHLRPGDLGRLARTGARRLVRVYRPARASDQ